MLRRSLLQQSRSLVSAAQLPSRTSIAPLLQRPQSISSRLPAPARARILSRWYSSAQEAQKDEAAEKKEGSSNTKEEKAGQEEDPVKKELEAKNREIVDLKDKYLRQVADYRNLQERTKREQQATKDFAIQKFARDLVESIDTFDLALSAVPAEKLAPPAEGAEDPDKELRQLHGGLKMTETVLLNTLKKHGLERFDPSETGDKFDPNLHEATFQTPQPDKEDGTVFYTTQKGFILNGRVLRAAKVGVVKNS